MKLATLTEDGFIIEEAPIPEIGPDELLVKMTDCGVCSGDLFVYQNRATMAAEFSRLGHEASGLVIAIGQNVTGFSEGDRITTFTNPAYAEYFPAHVDSVVPLPDAVNMTEALGEAIACCVHAANRFSIKSGDKVAIIGCGFMGLVCQQLAAYQHAGLIIGIDPIPERRGLSQELGAEYGYNPYETSAAAILGKHGPFDVVLEAVGNQSAIDMSTELVAEHGQIVLIGYHQSNKGMRQINVQQWNYKAIDVVNGHVRRSAEKLLAMQQGMKLMAQGYLTTKPLITTYSFTDIQRAFEQLDSRREGLLKAVLTTL